MSFIQKFGPATATPNWLSSEIGLTQQTREIPQSMGTTENCKITVKNGTIFPANDATAVGIIFTDTDVTTGDMPGSVMVAGRVLINRLPVTPAAAARTALEAQGIKFDTAPEMVRPWEV